MVTWKEPVRKALKDIQVEVDNPARKKVKGKEEKEEKEKKEGGGPEAG